MIYPPRELTNIHFEGRWLGPDDLSSFIGGICYFPGGSYFLLAIKSLISRSSEHQISQDSSKESLSRFDNLWIQHVEKLLNLEATAGWPKTKNCAQHQQEDRKLYKPVSNHFENYLLDHFSVVHIILDGSWWIKHLHDVLWSSSRQEPNRWHMKGKGIRKHNSAYLMTNFYWRKGKLYPKDSAVSQSHSFVPVLHL